VWQRSDGLQGWAATLLLCAQGDSSFIFFAGRQNKNLFYSKLLIVYTYAALCLTIVDV